MNNGYVTFKKDEEGIKNLAFYIYHLTCLGARYSVEENYEYYAVVVTGF